jgi:hypothetical protein
MKDGVDKSEIVSRFRNYMETEATMRKPVPKLF